MKFKVADNPDALLTALQKHEQALAHLYQAYSQRFEDYAVFWAGLAQEEFKHAACLGSLRKQLKDSSDIVIVERFSIDAIDSSIVYVNELVDRASEPEFKLLNALSLATKLEEALLEKNFFEVLSGDGQEIQEVLALLADETSRHLQTLRNTLKEHKGAGN